MVHLLGISHRRHDAKPFDYFAPVTLNHRSKCVLALGTGRNEALKQSIFLLKAALSSYIQHSLLKILFIDLFHDASGVGYNNISS